MVIRVYASTTLEGNANTYVGPPGTIIVDANAQISVADEQGTPGGIPVSANTGNITFSDTTIATANSSNIVLQAGTKDWTFTTNGSLLVPSPVSSIFLFTLDSSHYVPTEGKPVLNLTGSPWQLQGQFVYSLEGVVSLELNNPFPEYVNPGYDSNDAFAFGSDITGIPGYTLTLTLLDVVLEGGAGWTANVAASEPPAYPPSLQSRGATQITSGEVSYVLGADGHVVLPANVSGIPTEISLNGGPAVGYTTATNVPTVTDSGGGAGMTVDIVADGFSISSVAINQPGQGYAPGDQLMIDQQGSTGTGEITVVSVRATTSSIEWPGLANLSVNGSGSMELASGSNVWTFDNNGNLTLPAGGTINYSDGSNALVGGGGVTDLIANGSANLTISSDGTLVLSHPDEPVYHPLDTQLVIEKAAGNYHIISGAYGLSLQATPVLGGYGDLTNNNYVDIFHDGISINVNDNTWVFDLVGNLTLPSGGTINFSDGSNALVGGGGGTSSSLVSSNSVYNVNINDNGVFTVVQDINAPATASLSLNSDTQANLRWVSDIDNPGNNPATWVYVNSDGVNFQTFRNAPFNQYNAWQFDNNGTSTLPPGGAIASVNDSIYLTSNVVAVGNVLQTNTAFLQGRSINGASTFTVNALGTQGWISQYGGGFGLATGSYGSAVATEAATGETYSYGGQSNTAAVNNMVKYDAEGNVLWQTEMTWPIGSLAEGIGVEPHTRSLFAATQVYDDNFNTFSVSNLSTTDGTLVWETEININGNGGSYYRPYLYDMAYSREQGASSGNLWINHDGYNGVAQRAIAITQLDSVTGNINWSRSYRNSFESGTRNSYGGGIVTEYQPNVNIVSNNAYINSTGFYTPNAALVGKVGEDGNGRWLTRFTYQSQTTIGAAVAYDDGNVFAGGSIYAANTYAWLSSMDADTGTPHWTTRWTTGLDGAEGITAVAGAGNLYVAGISYDLNSIGITVSQINQETGVILWINELNTAWPYSAEFMDLFDSSAHALDWDSSDPQSPLVITWLNITGGMAGADSNQVTMRVPSDGSLRGEYGPWIYRNIAGGITQNYNDLTVTTGGNLSAVPLTATTTTGNLSITPAAETTWLNAMGPAAAWQFDQAGVLTLPDGGYLDNNGGITRLGAAGTVGAQIGSADTQNYVTASNEGVTIQTQADIANSNWVFDLNGYLTMPLHTRMNSGGVGNTNSAEFGTVVNTYGDNGVVQNSQIYMSAGTGEARILVNMEGHTLVYYGTEEVENPNFTGMVAMDPNVRSQYAIASENGNILLGGAQPGGTLISSDYIAGIGSLNNNYNMNGLYVDTTSVLISTGSEGAVNNSQQFGTNGISTTTTFGNISTNTSQAASYWLALAQDSTTGLYPAQAKIDVCLANIDTPEVYIDLRRASDGFNVLWTFDNTGNLTLPQGGTINWSDGSNALVGGGAVNTGNITFSDNTIGTSNAGNIVLSTNSNTWTFGADGIATIPGGSTIQDLGYGYGSGHGLWLNTAYNGNASALFQDSISNQIITQDYNNGHWAVINTQFTGGDSSHPEILLITNPGNGMPKNDWILGSDGTTYLPSNAVITSHNYDTGNVTTVGSNISIRTASDGPTYHDWTFSPTGNLRLPDTAGISSATTLSIESGTDIFLRAPAGGVGIYSGNSQLAITSGLGIETYADAINFTPNAEGDVLIDINNANTFVEIASPVGSWMFTGNGSLTFPDATVQPTAYQRTTGTWNVTVGSNTYSFTVPGIGTYSMWVRGNIPNGIIVWNATASVTNTNVPVIGQQFAWNYTGGGTPLEITAIPTQFIGTAGTIVSSNPSVGTTSNVFDFTINNASGAPKTVYWGYVIQ